MAKRKNAMASKAAICAKQKAPDVDEVLLFDKMSKFCVKHGAAQAFSLGMYANMSRTMAARGPELVQLIPLAREF